MYHMQRERIYTPTDEAMWTQCSTYYVGRNQKCFSTHEAHNKKRSQFKPVYCFDYGKVRGQDTKARWWIFR